MVFIMTDAALTTGPTRYGRKGARIGSRPGEAELFRDDMLAFWMRLFGKTS